MSSFPGQSVPFNHIIAALLDDQTPFPPKFLHRFSDLSPEELTQLKKDWPRISPARRASLLEDLEELAEVDTLVCFDDLSIFALNDSEPRARAAAIRLLWETENPKLIPTFINLVKNDGDLNVRASAATALGLFVYLGELEEIPEEIFRKVEDCLLEVATGTDDPLVRRRALESLGYSGRPEVPPLIRNAYQMNDMEWLASALFAMGRSADKVWERQVLKMIRYPVKEVQEEAIRAAGQLELASARQPLLELLEDPGALAEDVRAAAIWSLSQIGGPDVRDTLEELLDASEDEDEIEFIEQALDNLEFTDGFQVFDLFEVDYQDEDDLDQIIDLSDEDDGDNGHSPKK